MRLARIISFFFPLLSAGLACLLFIRPADFYSLLAVSLILVLVALLAIVKLSRQVRQPKEILFYLSAGFLLVLGYWLVLLLLENFWFKLGLILLATLALLYYCFFLVKKLYSISFLKKANPNFNFRPLEILIVFLLLTGLFGFIEFLNLSKLWLMATVGALIWLLSRLNEFIEAKEAEGQAFHWLVGLMAAEVFWAIVSLPFVYYIKGIIFSCLYLAFTLFRENANRLLDKKTVRNHLIFIILLLAAVLLTARWF